MADDFISQAMKVHAKILHKKYFYLGENPTVVTWSLYDDITTKHFKGNILYFKANKKFEIAPQISVNMWQRIWPARV